MLVAWNIVPPAASLTRLRRAPLGVGGLDMMRTGIGIVLYVGKCTGVSSYYLTKLMPMLRRPFQKGTTPAFLAPFDGLFDAMPDTL